jgi:hypothetical protein
MAFCAMHWSRYCPLAHYLSRGQHSCPCTLRSHHVLFRVAEALRSPPPYFNIRRLDTPYLCINVYVQFYQF